MKFGGVIMKNLRKVISMMLCLAMMFAMIPNFSAFATNANFSSMPKQIKENAQSNVGVDAGTWAQYAAGSRLERLYTCVDFSLFLDQKGNWIEPSDKTYTISTAKQLAGLMVIVNLDINDKDAISVLYYKSPEVGFEETVFKKSNMKQSFSGYTIKLANDIDLSENEWIPIGKDDSHPFSASFDGDGNEIKGMKIGYKEWGSTELVYRPYKYAGFIGSIKGENITISNVGIGENSEIYVSNDEYLFTGGLIGYACDSSFAIRNCYNTGAINAKNTPMGKAVYVGGIIGYASSVEISNCYNKGTIKTESQGNSYVGGIMGLDDSHFSFSSNISACYNTGAIEATTMSGMVYIGGIIGKIYSSRSSSSYITISCCYNTGAVTGKSTSASGTVFAGGIVGYIVYYTPSVEINNCYNTGAISDRRISSGNVYAGGIIGHDGYFYDSFVRIIDCYYTGANRGVCNEEDSKSGAINLLKDAQTESVELRPNEIKTIPNTEANVELRANSELQKLGKGFKMVYIYETPKDITISSEANEDNKLSISMIEGAKSGVAKLKGIKITQNALTKNGYTGNVFEFEKNLTCEKSFDINVLALN